MSDDDMIYRLGILTILLCCGAAEAHGPLRCKGKIIDTGETQEAVLALCGAPDMFISEALEHRVATIRGYSRGVGIVTSERWTYDRGYGRFAAVLTMDLGEVVAIDYLPFRSGG